MKLKSLLTGVFVLALALVFVQAAHAQSAASTANTSGSILTDPTTTVTPVASPVTTTTATPGLPNTGAGGESAANFVIILASGLLVVGGTVYALREFAR